MLSQIESDWLAANAAPFVAEVLFSNDDTRPWEAEYVVINQMGRKVSSLYNLQMPQESMTP